MKKFKYFLLTGLALAFAVGAAAQAAWIEPGGDAFNPDDSVTIYVDLNSTDNANNIIEAAESGEDMYLWTWKPAEHPAGHPLANGLGSQAWKNSNEALRMRPAPEIGPLVYKYRMVPTSFYEVDAATVYTENFAFLVKPKDGGGFGDPDIKTEDLTVEVNPPGLPKVFSIPIGVADGETAVVASTPDDVLTIVYDQKVEESENLRDEEEFWVYLRGTGSDGQEYQIAAGRTSVDEVDALKMRKNEDGTFTFSFIPNRFFRTAPVDGVEKLPEGVDMTLVRYQLLKKDARSTADLVSIGLKVEFRNEFNCN